MKDILNHPLNTLATLIITAVLALSLAACEAPSGSDSQEDQIQAERVTDANSRITDTESGLKIKITDLGTFGGDFSRANAINDRGQIVGQAQTPRDDYNGEIPFLWENGKMSELAEYAGFYSSATGINNNGAIIGFGDADGEPGGYIPFVYIDDQITWLHSMTQARAINDKGQIVGTLDNFRTSRTRAAIWENGNLTDLETLAGDARSYANSINEGGYIVGHSIGSAWKGVLWENGMIRQLKRIRSAISINEKNQIVGTCGGQAYILDNGNLTHLSGLDDFPFVSPTSINDKSQIAGSVSNSFSSPSFTRRAVVWLEDGTLVELGTLGGENSNALSLNNNGQIVGWSETVSGDRHATLWEILE